MKPGDQIRCPHCGADSFLKKESVMNGWVKTGEVLKCASCSAVIETLGGADRTEHVSSSSEAAERLRGFLGEAPLKKPELNFDSSEKRFCKDCIHLVKHPFVLRCDLDNHPVESMDDCPKFIRAKEI